MTAKGGPTTMRPVRGSAITILEPTKGRRRRPDAQREFVTIDLEVPKRLTLDFDVRRLMDRLRLALGKALRARAKPQLAKLYLLGPITGTPARARTWIRDTSRSADAYFAARFDAIAPDIIARETDEWVRESMPDPDPHTTVNTSGGPLPR